MSSAALDPAIAGRLKRNADGLVAAVVQDATTGDVLMQAWMNDEALHQTLTSGRSTFFSRSRDTLWVKGETSGHRQWVREVRLDCDGDTVLVIVDRYSKIVVLAPTTKQCNIVELGNILITKVVTKFGMPRGIVSDRGSLFTG